MDAISIRQAGAGDEKIIHRLAVALAETLGHSGDMKGRPADFARFGPAGEQVFEALIAERNGEPVGLCIHFPLFSSWRGRPGVFVLDLYVDDAVRGSGLGRRLLAEVARRARVRGATFMQLALHDGNDGGLGFYRRLGFEPVSGEQVQQLEAEGLAALAGGSVA